MGIFSSIKSVGLELKDNKLRAVELSKKRNKISIVNFGERQLPAGIIENGKVKDSHGLTTEIADLWSKSGFSSKEVVLGISNRDVIVRFASFPKISQKKLDNVVKLQAQNILPIDINQLVVDYAVIGEGESEENSVWEVLIVGGKKAMVYEFIASLEAANLSIREIEVLPVSMGRLLDREQHKQGVIMVDDTGGVVNLSVFDGGHLRLARMITPSDSDAKENTVNGEIAASVDVHASQSNSVILAEDRIDYIVSNITMLIDYYQTQNSEKPIDAIVLCGTVSENQTLMDKLNDELGLPVNFSDPLIALGIKGSELGETDAKNYSQVISFAHKGLEGD